MKEGEKEKEEKTMLGFQRERRTKTEKATTNQWECIKTKPKKKKNPKKPQKKTNKKKTAAVSLQC